jgi:cytochrome c-type biogenesis protein CcmH
MSEDVQALRKQLQQLTELHTSGVVDDAAYKESRARLERRLVDAVMSGAPVETESRAQPAATSSRPPLKLLGGLGAAVLVLAMAGYWWTGSPDRAGEAAASNEGAAGQGGQGQGQGHAMNFEQIAAMADKLAERLKEQPNDPEGWTMLARSYNVLGRNPEAVDAYKKAVDLRSDDATLLADYADALAVKNNRSLSGEPMKLIERALKLEPNNLKALSLAGTAAFDRKDYAAAVTYWDKIIQTGPADNALVQQVQSSVAEARELGKLPNASKPVAPTAAVAPADASLSGTVTLAAALGKQASPDDTVFVFARAADGPPMPLAVLRKQVKDLPITFKLDDSMSMSPAAKLSGASKVIVSARVSKSGDAIAQNGDLLGQSAPVAVGAAGLKIEINNVVKK